MLVIICRLQYVMELATSVSYGVFPGMIDGDH